MGSVSPASPKTRADVLATLAHRFQKHYGDRLMGLYATQEDPYEPMQEGGKRRPGVHVVVVLQGPYKHWEETDDVTDITHDVMDESDWTVPITSHHVTHDSTLARRMKREGVRFD